jgi:hypothetical protein
MIETEAMREERLGEFASPWNMRVSMRLYRDLFVPLVETTTSCFLTKNVEAGKGLAILSRGAFGYFRICLKQARY